MNASRSTSSRLDRSLPTPRELAKLERALTADALAHCERALAASRFFRALAAGALTLGTMQYVFLQYRFFRDQLHRWFGLCIAKAPSCFEPALKQGIMALADHVFTDLRDDHGLMYDRFLEQLAIGKAEILAATPSPATLSYTQSFLDDFAGERHDFATALAALGSRELVVALRNRRLLSHYFDRLERDRPEWLVLHADVEREHFHDAIRPVLASRAANRSTVQVPFSAMTRTIDRHLLYFDELLLEYEGYGAGGSAG